MAGYIGLSVVLTILAIIVLVLWIFLPFAVFGLKPIVQQLLTEVKRTNTLLADLVANSEAMRTAAANATSVGGAVYPAVTRKHPDRA